MIYILNEKKYIEEILKSKSKPDDLPKSNLITLIAKYYYDPEIFIGDFVELVKAKMREFNFSSSEYQEYKWAGKITNICKNIINTPLDYELIIRDFIPIYSHDIEVINKCETDREKKLLFTLFILARYMNCDGWVNKKDLKGWTEMFKLANISLVNDKKCELIHKLYKDGVITMSKKVDNLNIRVDISETDEIVYKVTEFTNLGNQYIGNFKKGYKQCVCCGKRIKNTGNKKKYCDNCAEINVKESWINASKKYRSSKSS